MGSLAAMDVAAESGLIIPAAEVTGLVSSATRAAHMPPHITLLYPFVEPPVPDEDLRRLAHLFRSVAPFEYVLDAVAWFEERTVYLRPVPAEPFVALTRRLVELWPDRLPYGGEHGSDPVPHLTLADQEDPAEMGRLAVQAEPRLPIRLRADEVWLMEGTHEPPRWHRTNRFALGRDIGKDIHNGDVIA